MKPCKVIVKDGKGREVNPQGNDFPADNWPRGDDAVWEADVVATMKNNIRKWNDFEQSVKTYPAPNIPDGSHFCVLQWQLLDDPTGNWFNIDNPQNWKDSTVQQNWTLAFPKMNTPNNKCMDTVEEEPFEYFSLETLKRVCQSLRQETRPIKGHNNAGAIQDCWNTVNDILPLLFSKEEVKRIAYRSAELAATPHLTPNLDQIIENRGYVVDKPKDHEFGAQWAKQQSDGDRWVSNNGDKT